MRVVRVDYAARDRAHRARNRALAAAGVELTLVVPLHWPGEGHEAVLSPEPFEVVEVAVSRPGDYNRHGYPDRGELAAVLRRARPDVVDLHEEPFSLGTRHWLRAVDPAVPVVCFAAQNVDKRYPPPFSGWESAAYRRLAAVYPCSRQAASVVRGKGYQGLVREVPLGIDESVFAPGAGGTGLGFVGRLVPEKGVLDAVTVAARLGLPLDVVGTGPIEGEARALAASLGADVRWHGHLSHSELAAVYQRLGCLLVPSRTTTRWVEQFGRVIVEAQACGVPVVAYASGAIPEVVGSGGVVVPEGDVAALASAVGAAAAMREAAQARSSAYSWEAVAGRMTSLYDEVVAAGPRALAVRPDRAAAREEWGAPAPLLAGDRPFALPVLRNGGALARGLGALVDRASSVRGSRR